MCVNYNIVFQKAWSSGRLFDEAAALESLQSTLRDIKDKVIRQWAGVELQQSLKNATDTHEANITKLRGTFYIMTVRRSP